jgi:hypothetical protein
LSRFGRSQSTLHVSRLKRLSRGLPQRIGVGCNQHYGHEISPTPRADCDTAKAGLAYRAFAGLGRLRTVPVQLFPFHKEQQFGKLFGGVS